MGRKDFNNKIHGDDDNDNFEKNNDHYDGDDNGNN